jgi:hypothetical protein
VVHTGVKSLGWENRMTQSFRAAKLAAVPTGESPVSGGAQMPL